MKKILAARSPAKLILSGEHSVLYGHEALAIAVNRYAESRISSHLLPKIVFHFLNLDYARSFTLQALTVLKHRLQEQYYDFLQGNCSIREVLKMPFELLQFAVSNVLEKMNIALPHGIEIHTSSNIPMGCGMGSSAASVMSIIFALAHFLKIDILPSLDTSPSRFLTLGKEAENLQHGRSSGLDLQLALQGGCLQFKEGKVEKRFQPDLSFTVVQTGKPETTTGQCVMDVAPYFNKENMGKHFACVTLAMAVALEQGNMEEMKRLVQENHRLLQYIGVVPLKVSAFIDDIEKRGGAAKICGAGATAGQKGGVVWVLCDEDVSDIIDHYQFEMLKVKGDFGGTTCLNKN